MFISLLLIGLVSGVLLGLVLALMATGFNLALGVARVVNFQIGAMILWAMYGTFFAWSLLGLHPYLAIFIVAPSAFVLGSLMHRYLVIRSQSTAEDSQILFSLGLLIALQYLAQFCFSTDTRSLVADNLQGALQVGPVIVQYTQVAAGAVALVVLAVMHYMLACTDLGRHLQACAQNPVGAQVSGLNVKNLSSVAMGISALCASVAGLALATLMPIYPERAFEYSVMAVVVSVLGGMGSMAGSVLGGLLVGVIISTCQAMGYGAMAQAIVYALVFIAFLIRPNGLIKSKQG
jgi:branched-chain amino acid transport system permease protein